MNGPNKLVLRNTRLESIAMDKHSCLLVPFISYKENEVLWAQSHGSVFTTLHLFIAYKCAPKARAYTVPWSVIFKLSCFVFYYHLFDEMTTECGTVEIQNNKTKNEINWTSWCNLESFIVTLAFWVKLFVV
jgi:hypothetical protein